MSELRPPRYLKAMNRLVRAIQRLGLHTGPAMTLTVPGRKTGKPRSTPMTPFTFGDGLYTVAGYPGADWAANARAAGAGTLTHGRKSREVRIVELNAERHARCFARSRRRSPSASGSRNAPGSSGTARRTSLRRSQGNWRCFGSFRRPSRRRRRPAAPRYRRTRTGHGP